MSFRFLFKLYFLFSEEFSSEPIRRKWPQRKRLSARKLKTNFHFMSRLGL